jgi:hypothetical protein
MSGPLDSIPLPALVLVAVAVVLLSIEAGFRLGRRRRRIAEDEKEAPVGAIVAATLGLLGFVLAFTYGVAANRFDAGRRIIVDEANVVGTTYLRAGLLDDARKLRVRQLLQEYVDERLQARETRDIDRVMLRSNELHRALWNEAEAAGRAQPESIAVGLFIHAVNDTIDMHSTRILVSLQNRIPLVLWGTLMLVTVLTMAGVGYLCGLSRSRRSLSIGVLALSFSALFYIVADLDRPGEGLIDIGNGALQDVRRMMTELP